MQRLKRLVRFTLALAVLTLSASISCSQESIEGIDKTLAKELDFNIENVTLREAVATISKKYKTPFFTHRLDLENEWIDDLELKITLQSKGQSLHAALDAMLAPHGLTWIKRHDAVLITTSKATADRYSEVHVYKTTRKVQVARRVHSIQTSVAPQSWKVNGGNGDISPLPPDFIVIRQSPPVHREIASTFRQSLALVESAGEPSFGSDLLDKALSGAASIDASETPLASVIKQLAEKHKIKITTDQTALQDSEIDLAELKVSLRANVPRLSSALSLLLEMAHPDLLWVVDGKALKVTTKAAAAKSANAKTYDVNDIVAKVDGKYLVEAIEYNLSPATWEFGGGDGKIELTDDGRLIVNQSEPVHLELSRLLGDLRYGLRDLKSDK